MYRQYITGQDSRDSISPAAARLYSVTSSMSPAGRISYYIAEEVDATERRSFSIPAERTSLNDAERKAAPHLGSHLWSSAGNEHDGGQVHAAYQEHNSQKPTGTRSENRFAALLAAAAVLAQEEDVDEDSDDETTVPGDRAWNSSPVRKGSHNFDVGSSPIREPSPARSEPGPAEFKRWPCLYKGCPRSFRTDRTRRRHLDVHYPWRYSCLACGETFHRPRLVKIHRKVRGTACFLEKELRRSSTGKRPWAPDPFWMSYVGKLKAPSMDDPIRQYLRRKMRRLSDAARKKFRLLD